MLIPVTPIDGPMRLINPAFIREVTPHSFPENARSMIEYDNGSTLVVQEDPAAIYSSLHQPVQMYEFEFNG